MAKKNTPFHQVRLVYRRSKPLTKMAVAVVIVLSMAALLSLSAARHRAAEWAEALRTEAAALEEANRYLRQDIEQLGTPQSIEQIAQQELGLVKPGTVFFQPEK